MPKFSRKSLLPGSSLAVLILLPVVCASTVLAAPPDAGDILRQQPQAPVVVPDQKPPITPAITPGQEVDIGPRILVKGFRIMGANLIPEAELAAQLTGYVGKELSFRQLRKTTLVLIAYYVRKGYLARVTLPEQDIQDGVVVLHIVEGKRGGLRIDSKGERIDAARVERFVNSRLSSGDPFSIPSLGEVLNILNEQPGIGVTTSLLPGKGEGDIDVIINAAEKPLMGFFLGADNRGSTGTGVYQAVGGLVFSNPSGNFDMASIMVSASAGTTFGRADYSIAVQDAGLRVGINASSLRYRVIQSTFSALQARGTADTFGLTASYPLSRRADLSLSVAGSYDIKQLVDRTIAGETGNRRVAVAHVGLTGNMPYGAPGGVLSFGVGLSLGNGDQHNAAALAADRVTRKEQGGFAKVSYNAGYLWPIAQAWNLGASLRGQFVDKNLDSSERFGLGGPTGVRAYPVGEASGDEGQLLSVNLSRNLGNNLAANVFYDTGSVRLNRNTWANWNGANPNLPNTYRLSGMGVGLDWRVSSKIVLNASIATPLGSNPGRDATGMNSDGHGNHARAWFGLAAPL